MSQDELVAGIRAGDRRALSRGITLVESTRPDHRREAADLLDELIDETGGAVRVAVTGSPGAGKSTLIEALGLHLIERGHKVAVLAIDPSSQRSRGSILGDKTRMDQLAREAAAYIRPSPSGGTLGGIARRTREALLLCEAAGHDVVIVETVGVGQSETTAAAIVDCTILLVAPGGGDELQGIKRGIMELADIALVNKADGDLLPAAQRAAGGLRTALHLLPAKHPGWDVPVLLVSAATGAGIDEAWERVGDLVRHLDSSDLRASLRGDQAVSWMWSEVREQLFDEARRHMDDLPSVVEAVRRGETSPAAAAQRLSEAAVQSLGAS